MNKALLGELPIARAKMPTPLISALYWYIAVANTIIKRHVLVVGVVHILLDSYGELYISPL